MFFGVRCELNQDDDSENCIEATGRRRGNAYTEGIGVGHKSQTCACKAECFSGLMIIRSRMSIPKNVSKSLVAECFSGPKIIKAGCQF